MAIPLYFPCRKKVSFRHVLTAADAQIFKDSLEMPSEIGSML